MIKIKNRLQPVLLLHNLWLKRNEEENNVETEQEIYTIDSEGNLIKQDAPAPQNVINILDNVG